MMRPRSKTSRLTQVPTAVDDVTLCRGLNVLDDGLEARLVDAVPQGMPVAANIPQFLGHVGDDAAPRVGLALPPACNKPAAASKIACLRCDVGLSKQCPPSSDAESVEQAIDAAIPVPSEPSCLRCAVGLSKCCPPADTAHGIATIFDNAVSDLCSVKLPAELVPFTMRMREAFAYMVLVDRAEITFEWSRDGRNMFHAKTKFQDHHPDAHRVQISRTRFIL
ncbi:uncharacterized protein B0H64DRAFT_474137 [Chaetomium fimeti]|uniref:Uncharacterized protein n=1 Tax=Chaetomium fimeti TaxID=1854472 RepID=A0AAE0HEW6_9PEZI|nr:hypothetical protein B0H64DRAFT_474137 [Chaetomium fimeti]